MFALLPQYWEPMETIKMDREQFMGLCEIIGVVLLASAAASLFWLVTVLS